MASFREMMSGDDVVIAPLALNPLSAVIAKQNGFKALYVGGGALGYLKCVTEANLTEPEFAQVALDIRTVCDLPLILDGACGWGDPMHMHRTIALAEAAGFSAIEIEDQILPKRAHHHAGTEHLIPMEDMVDKVREAAAARQNPDFVIIGRTNAARSYDFDEAMRRLEAYREAGADVLLSYSQDPDHTRMMGERLGPPLMQMVPALFSRRAQGSGLPTRRRFHDAAGGAAQRHEAVLRQHRRRGARSHGERPATR